MNKLLRTLNSPPPEFSAELAEQVARDAFGLEGRAEPLGGERDRNFLLHASSGDAVIKVANPAEPDDLLAFQCAALRHIAEQDPGLPVSRPIATRDGRDWAEANGQNGNVYRVRAFDYLRGLTLADAPDDARLMRNLGRLLGRLDRALRGFFHPAADHLLAWDLKRSGELADLVAGVAEPEVRELAQWAVDSFQKFVAPALPGLRAQIIHNDVSFHNTVVDPDEPFEISGVFDFGDIVHAPLLQDLAVTAAEVPAGRTDPFAVCADIVAGYHSMVPLEPEEFEMLPRMISMRLAMSTLLGYWCDEHTQWKEDRDHLHGWHARSVVWLKEIEQTGHSAMEKMLRAACGKTPAGLDVSQVEGNDLSLMWQRRKSRLGNANVVSYDDPVHLVRGEGVWLFDSAGRAYLDAYNNVPHVGHCHPHVVSAVVRQTAALNTNTRYMYEAILSYAERLVATLPDGLDVCYFVSSGSEANDLAWRIARACTGNTGGIVIEEAYHGLTEATFALSPEGFEDRPVAAHIATMPAPNEYRGPWGRDIADRPQRYAEYCEAAIQDLRRRGHAPAALFVDPILSSSGIFIPPPGYLSAVFKYVRAAGGLCVADEVQSGFGRIGTHMWGFQVDDVAPDIVTFGKPIAGGYPMGLVVTTRELADRFERHSEFFSTTGGNPVACAAAGAVLDVIEHDELLRHATEVGTELIGGVHALADKHDLIGDVRGSGLFIGVELVTDRATQTPAPEQTHAVVNTMRRQGVLIGRSGKDGNILKIRPPMVFGSVHARRLLACLDEALDSQTR